MQTVLHTESSLGHGGQEIRTLAEVRWLRSHGWGALIACQPDSPLLGEAKASSIPAQAVRMRGATDVGALLRLRRLMRERAVSVVHTHSSVDSWLATAAAKSLGLPVVRTRHVSIPIGRRRALVYRLADRIITSGESVRAIVIASGIAPERVVSISAGVDGERFHAGVSGASVRDELARDGENGRLVPPGDAKALANAILALLGDPERARAMARAGQALIQERYSIDATMTRTTAVYRTLLDAGPRRRHQGMA